MKGKRKWREGKRNKKGDGKRVRQHERVSRLEDDNAKRKQEEVGDGEKGGVEGGASKSCCRTAIGNANFPGDAGTWARPS